MSVQAFIAIDVIRKLDLCSHALQVHWMDNSHFFFFFFKSLRLFLLTLLTEYELYLCLYFSGRISFNKKIAWHRVSAFLAQIQNEPHCSGMGSLRTTYVGQCK